MIYSPLTSSISGAGTIDLNGYLFGGALISADGTNAATIIVREDDSSGKVLYHLITKSPAAPMLPIKSNSKQLYYSVTGTGASAQFFEWVE